MTARTPTTLAAEVRALRDLPASALRQRYQSLSGRTTRTDNRAWLLPAVIRLLTQGARPADPNARRALARAVHAALQPRHTPRTRPVDPRIPPPGSVLRRRHGEQDVEVVVLQDGFRWQGRHYTSLSKIACEATGQKWNGVLWFGLRPRQRGRPPKDAA